MADKPWDLSAIAYKRLERVEESLQLTRKSIEDSTLPEMCVNIERQIIQTRQAVQRTEAAVDRHQRARVLRDIDARLVRTEDSLRRTEGIVAEWLRGLSASMTTRFSDAEETIQRIERIVSSRTVEQTSPPPPSAPSGQRVLLRTALRAAMDGPRLTRAWIGVGDGLRDRDPDHLEPRRNAGEGCVARGHRADVDIPVAPAMTAAACNSVYSRGRRCPRRSSCRRPSEARCRSPPDRRCSSGQCRSRPFRPAPGSPSMARPRASRR